MTLRLWIAAWGIVAVAIVVLGLIVKEPLLMAVLVTAPMAVASFFVCRAIEYDRELRLTECFVTALTLRWLVACAIHYLVYPTYPYVFAIDEAGYDVSGLDLSRHLASEIPNPGYELPQGGIIHLVAVCYYLIGHVPMLPKLINGVVGAWTAVLTALIGAQMVSVAVGRRAGVLAAVFPSLVLWGAIVVKDMHTLLGALMALLGAMRLAQRGQLRNLPLIAAGLGLVLWNRSYQALFVAGALASGFTFAGDARKNRARTWILALVLVPILGFMLSGVFSEFVLPWGSDEESIAARVSGMRAGYGDAGSALDTSGFETDSTIGVLAWLPFGVAALYLAPIPFTGSSLISSATTPEMLVWYWLLPSVFRGLRIVYRAGQLKRMVAPLVYTLLASVGWASVVTNVGTLYRYRAQMLFVPLIFIALDQVQRKAQKQARALASSTAAVPRSLAPAQLPARS
ncbi:MAG: hypothetical protein ACOY0T_23075 [Myxococcota bacterium]